MLSTERQVAEKTLIFMAAVSPQLSETGRCLARCWCAHSDLLPTADNDIWASNLVSDVTSHEDALNKSASNAKERAEPRVKILETSLLE